MIDTLTNRPLEAQHQLLNSENAERISTAYREAVYRRGMRTPIAVFLIEAGCAKSRTFASRTLGIEAAERWLDSNIHRPIVDVASLRDEEALSFMHPFLKNMYATWLHRDEVLVLSVKHGQVAKMDKHRVNGS